MIAGGGGIEALDELSECGTVGVRRGITLQDDPQIVCIFKPPAGSTLPKFDGGPRRHCESSRSRKIARDLMNLRGCEAVHFLLFTATEKEG